jgi:hypothetical protein
MTTTLPQTAAARADVKAIVSGYVPSEMVNGITSGSRKIIVSRLDLEDAGYPVPLKKGDRIYLGAGLDVPTTIQTVDEDHREYLGCYDIVTQGGGG